MSRVEGDEKHLDSVEEHLDFVEKRLDSVVGYQTTAFSRSRFSSLSGLAQTTRTRSHWIEI
jgi:hypothetical protein